MWDMKNKVCNSFGNFWYEGDTCPDCSVELDFDNTSYSAGTNGPTSGKAWGSPKRIKYCEEDWLKRRKKMPSRISKKEKARLLNTAPAQEYFDWVDSQKESVVKQRVVSIKSRDSSLPSRMKKEYSYRCQVEKCNESSEVELAHLYPHSRPDSVDNPTNALVLCANHHRALDGHRMCIELDLTFSRYDRGDNQIESGKIICHDWHKIDPKFIKKSQEWFIDDTKEQALG